MKRILFGSGSEELTGLEALGLAILCTACALLLTFGPWLIYQAAKLSAGV